LLQTEKYNPIPRPTPTATESIATTARNTKQHSCLLRGSIPDTILPVVLRVLIVPWLHSVVGCTAMEVDPRTPLETALTGGSLLPTLHKEETWQLLQEPEFCHQAYFNKE
jgi:hypothetical protein